MKNVKYYIWLNFTPKFTLLGDGSVTLETEILLTNKVTVLYFQGK